MNHMDEGMKKMLAETLKLSQENNAYLKKIDRRQRWNAYVRALTIIIAIGSALGIYYYFQPYVDQFIDIYNQAEKTFIQFGTIPEQLRNLRK